MGTSSKTYKSARELFSSGYIRDAKLDQKGIEAAFAASGHKKCGMQRPGFNIVCKDGQKARWGFCNNIPSQGCQTSDNNDSDAAIGVGLVGNFKDKVSAGWTKDFAGKGKIVYKKVWISVATKKYDWDGWTPVMKIISGSTFGYNAKYWTDGSTLKPTSPLNKLQNAKYAAFNTEPVGSIRICADSPNKHCFDHEFKSDFPSARALFSAGYIRDPTLSQSNFEDIFSAQSSGRKNCGMQRPGANIVCKDGQKARFGFCNNIPSQGCQTSDNSDSDAAIGIGLVGNFKDSVGAGWTKDFAGKSKIVYKKVWLYTKPPKPWTLVMKIMSGGTFGYNSAYWTNQATLKSTSPRTKQENAKYATFMTVPVTKIRICTDAAGKNCFLHKFDQSFPSAMDLFSAGYIRDPTLEQSNFEKIFSAANSGRKSCGMQRPGANIVCKDGQKARFGFCNNIPSQSCQTADSSDSDAAIGIGLIGNHKDSVGAGWTKDFAGKGKIVYKKIWLFVQ